MELPVCKEIMVLSLAEGIQMYSKSHVEHQGCELRKASSSHGRSGCRCISAVRSHPTIVKNHGCSWLLLATPGCARLLLAAPGWAKNYALATSDVTLQLSLTRSFPRLVLATSGCSWLFLTAPAWASIMNMRRVTLRCNCRRYARSLKRASRSLIRQVEEGFVSTRSTPERVGGL